MSELPELPERNPDSHKGKFGRLLVIAGSFGMLGAGALASRAALRSGAGLVTWAVPLSLSSTAMTYMPELITLPLPETKQKALSVDAREHLLEASMEADAVVLGPGLPVAGESGELMRLLIAEIKAPLLIDAGALRAIASDLRPVASRKNPTVLTPHPGEMAGLTNVSVNEIQADRSKSASELAKKISAVVVLKGNDTVIADGNTCFVNETGNDGMATAGSGDVLCGVIAALIGQKMPVYDAAVAGTYLHGLAGDIAAGVKGRYSLIASDIIEALPEAFNKYIAK